MPRPTPFRLFNRLMFAIAFGTLMLVAAFNVAIDATGLFDVPEVRGFNANKEQQHLYERLVKAHILKRLRPARVILGSSRARLGVDPRDFKALTGNAAYNASLGSPHISELEAYFREALHDQPALKEVVLVVEVQEFGPRVAATEQAQDFVPARLERDHLPARDYLVHTLTLNALWDSWLTLEASVARPDARPYGPQGQDLDLPWRRGLTALGPAGAFEGYITLVRGPKAPSVTYDARSMDCLQRIVSTCRARGIRLEVLTSPEHVVAFETLWQVNQGAEIERFERDLAAVTPYWDFSGFNAVTTAAIAPRMPYLDPAHYLPSVGARMLARAYGKAPAGFGERVDAASVSSHLTRLKAARRAWLASNPALAARLVTAPRAP